MRELVTTCDICGDRINPGTRTARSFEVNGKLLDCCGIKCFVDFWAGHYHSWDRLQISFSGEKVTVEPQLALVKNQAN
jgi:hypothetical protein